MLAILLFSLYLFTASCNAASPNKIAYLHFNDYPESIGYSPSLGCFITGAGRNPPYTLLKIFDNGAVEQFAPSAQLSAGNLLVQGIKVDEPNQRIYYVATSTQQTLLPIPVKNESYFAIANFNGTIERIVDLTPLADPGTSVTANDLVLDENKNVYITDNSGRLLKVDKDGVASVVLGLTGFPSLLSSGIAGIVYLQANRSLVIANELLNEFYRVDIASRASSKVIVRTILPTVQPNGMVLGQDGNIYVTSALVSIPSVVFALRSSTNFTTATVVNYGTEVEGAPKAGTGLVFRNNKLFICHALLPATTPLVASGTVDKIKLLY